MTTATTPSVRTVWLLLSGYLGAVLLNVHHTALWCMPLALGAAIWRARRTQTLPGKSRRVLRTIMIVILTAAVLIGFRTLNGVQAGASLLVAMAALKLTETSMRRDWLIVVGASLFLLLAACLDAQMLWRLPLYAAELCLLCMGMYALNASAEVPPVRTLLRWASFNLLAAMPFAILLFLFVPRVAGSFWALPRQHAATTGLSDEMNPGNISSLSESGEAAARIRFEGNAPPVELRYWRGFVLDSFDGNTWRRTRRSYGRAPPMAVSGTSYRYDVSLEPTQFTVLLALELPQNPPGTITDAHLTDDYQLMINQPITQAVNYRVESFPEHRILPSQQLPADERQRNLRFPDTRNVRSIELAHTLRAEADSDSEYIRRVLDYFHRGGFKYALDPELSNENSVDDLLFNTHEGFCGHYASAFVQLMRAAGIPARVITGYQGGIWNRYGNYLLVRQSDAHAWAEVWLDGYGWQRVDPTAVVAPKRLTQGADELSLNDSLTRNLFRYTWIANTLQAWQAMNAWWQDEFVGFNFDKQQSLLEGIGIKQHYLRALALMLAIGGGAWLGVIAWSLRPRNSRRADDALSRSWRLLERKLRSAAPPRAPYEGALAYAERIGQDRPEIAGMVIALARRYARLRYGPAPSGEEFEQFRRAVRLLRPIQPRRER
jgi:transglutaminase-like putative cysteine protease